MDWLGLLTVMALVAAGYSLWKWYRLKQEVYRFEAQVEEALDEILLGKILEDTKEGEETRDSLWGKCREKIQRVNQIWLKKDEMNLKEKQRMKELISDISHQTKTPIANIKLYLEFLQEEKLSDKGEEFLENLGGQVDKLDFLLKGLVKMSRLESGILHIQSRKQSIYETLAGAVAQIVPAAAKKEIEIHVDCEKNIEIYHDRKWTEEAIFNVLDNGVKYTPPQGSIYISVVSQEMFTKISIKDTGKGIPREHQAEIFSRFYREPEVHNQNGLGIGLYLTRKILELQDGYIEVRSQEKRGSEFCLYLPKSQFCDIS